MNASLNIDSRNADGWAGLGLAFEKKGDKEQARENYQRALGTDPANQAAKEGLARLSGSESGGGLGGFLPKKWF